MALTPAERQRRYRERLKKRAAAGDEKAIKQISKRVSTSAQGFSRAKTFIRKHATANQLKDLQTLIQKRLDK